MKNDFKSNPKGAGRKVKFTEEELLKIIDSFLINEYRGKIKGSALAEYAIKNLGYEKDEIHGYHFLQKEAIKDKIEEIQKERKRKYVSDTLQMFQNIELDSFVDKNLKNPLKLKETLFQLQTGQKEMFNNIMRLDSENRELKAKLDPLIKLEDSFKKERKSLIRDNLEQTDKIKMLQSLIEVDNQVKMYKYIKEKTYMDGDWAEQYLLFLLKCGVVSEIDSEEIITTEETSSQTLTNKVTQMFRDPASSQKAIKLDKDTEGYEYVSMDEINKLLDD